MLDPVESEVAKELQGDLFDVDGLVDGKDDGAREQDGGRFVGRALDDDDVSLEAVESYFKQGSGVYLLGLAGASGEVAHGGEVERQRDGEMERWRESKRGARGRSRDLMIGEKRECVKKGRKEGRKKKRVECL